VPRDAPLRLVDDVLEPPVVEIRGRQTHATPPSPGME
jgi:hypothetical protein